jgi:hypothetical protein
VDSNLGRLAGIYTVILIHELLWQKRPDFSWFSYHLAKNQLQIP